MELKSHAEVSDKLAEELIRQLDEMSARVVGATEVALLSSRGLIYSWHKNKLANLKFSLPYGHPYGMLTVTEDADDTVHVHMTPIFDPDIEGSTASILELTALIDDVLEVVQCGYEEGDEDVNFRVDTEASSRSVQSAC